MNATDNRIANSLFLLRISVFVVILMWTLDKFLNPEHSAGVFANFYGLSGWGPTVFMVIGALELVLLAAFVTGFKKTLSYGLVFAIHAVSTVSTWKQLLNPYDGGLLFYAALPMLAACWALFSLRDLDRKFTLGSE